MTMIKDVGFISKRVQTKMSLFFLSDPTYTVNPIEPMGTTVGGNIG